MPVWGSPPLGRGGSVAWVRRGRRVPSSVPQSTGASPARLLAAGGKDATASPTPSCVRLPPTTDRFLADDARDRHLVRGRHRFVGPAGPIAARFRGRRSAVRVSCVEHVRGLHQTYLARRRRPADFALSAFGGAGPLVPGALLSRIRWASPPSSCPSRRRSAPSAPSPPTFLNTRCGRARPPRALDPGRARPRCSGRSGPEPPCVDEHRIEWRSWAFATLRTSLRRPILREARSRPAGGLANGRLHRFPEGLPRAHERVFAMVADPHAPSRCEPPGPGRGAAARPLGLGGRPAPG